MIGSTRRASASEIPNRERSLGPRWAFGLDMSLYSNIHSSMYRKIVVRYVCSAEMKE